MGDHCDATESKAPPVLVLEPKESRELPGGFKKGDRVYNLYVLDGNCGAKLWFGSLGTVKGLAKDGNKDKLLVVFDKNGSRWHLHPDKIHREEPLPGGFKRGDRVYSLIAEEGMRSDGEPGNEICYGATGTVMGPCKNDEELFVVFDGPAGNWDLHYTEIRMKPTRTPRSSVTDETDGVSG